MTPEEKLLRAIFGERLRTSRYLLRLPRALPERWSRSRVFNRHASTLETHRAIRPEEKERLKRMPTTKRVSSIRATSGAQDMRLKQVATAVPKE